MRILHKSVLSFRNRSLWTLIESVKPLRAEFLIQSIHFLDYYVHSFKAALFPNSKLPSTGGFRHFFFSVALPSWMSGNRAHVWIYVPERGRTKRRGFNKAASWRTPPIVLRFSSGETWLTEEREGERQKRGEKKKRWDNLTSFLLNHSKTSRV